MGVNIIGKVTLSPGGGIWVPGSCHEINLNGTGWGSPATIYNVKLYDSSIDIPFVTPLIPSWYYSSSGAHIKTMYCEVRPSQDSSGNRNQALILFVANDNTTAQWVYGYFQFNALTSELSLQGEHYSNPPNKSNNPSGPWLWRYGGLTRVPMLPADEAAFFNKCPKGAGYLLAPGDGIFYSLNIT